jgi:hypothetical protein
MRYLFSFATSIFLSVCSLHSDELQFNDFIPEKLTVDGNRLYVISNFDQIQYFTVFSYEGDPIWEIPFSSKIISCEKDDEKIFIFSKARDASVYYLTCLDAENGKLLWEKPVFSPK